VVGGGDLGEEEAAAAFAFDDDAVVSELEVVEVVHGGRRGEDRDFDVEIGEFGWGDGGEAWVFACGAGGGVSDGVGEGEGGVEGAHAAAEFVELMEGDEDAAVGLVRGVRGLVSWRGVGGGVLDDGAGEGGPGFVSVVFGGAGSHGLAVLARVVVG
jgi:hypothetical protein